jgi:hypothetical protein
VIGRVGLIVGLTLALALAAAPALADSFTPVVLTIDVPATAEQGVALPVSVTVSADAGVLDTSEGPMRIGVRLAPGDCGGDFETTPGTTLLDAQLSPQPATGKAYTATAKGTGKPTAVGEQTVCVFLEDADVHRVYANDESRTVDVKRVSAACVARARAYTAAVRALARATRKLAADERRRKTPRATLRRLKRTVAARKRTVARDRRLARASCGARATL